MSSRWALQWRYAFLGMLWLVGGMPALARACAVCWGGDDALTQAFNTSMLFLMGMPFVIGGSILGVIFMAQKRARSQRWSSGSGKPLA